MPKKLYTDLCCVEMVIK